MGPAAQRSSLAGRLPDQFAACEAPGGHLQCGMPAATGGSCQLSVNWDICSFGMRRLDVDLLLLACKHCQNPSAHPQRTLTTVATSMAGIGTDATTSAMLSWHWEVALPVPVAAALIAASAADSP